MAIYEYRCDEDGVFEVTLPLGTAPPAITCPECGGQARRVFTKPMSRSSAPRALVAAIEHEEKSRDEPDVVTSLPRRAHAGGRLWSR